MILQQRCLLLAAKIKSAAQAPEVIFHWAPDVGAFKVFGLYCQISSAIPCHADNRQMSRL